MCLSYLLADPLLFIFFISGYPAHPWHHPPVPERPGPAWPDVPAAAVFRNPAGPGPTQQVWVSGAVQTCPSAGPQTTAGEMAEGGQGMWRSQGRWVISTHTHKSHFLCTHVFVWEAQGTECALHMWGFFFSQTERMHPYFCDKERVCVKTDCVDCENDCLCVNVCVFVCYLRCLL